MCGITGFLAPQPIATKAYLSGHRLLSHRGPDDEGFVAGMGDSVVPLRGDRTIEEFRHLPELDPASQATWVLGHHRLSIVDLSASGHQPMATRDSRYWIVFNGEIYNHVELRAELESLGHRFASRSDTEVILHAYQEWSMACFNRFNGMWALAIYDTQDNTLLLSRDRLGVKPLFWTQQGGTLYFASELKCMRPILAQVQLNEAMAADFLATSRSEHRSETLVQGVRQLPPGQCMVYNTRETMPLFHTYWQLPTIASDLDLTYGQAVAQLQELFNSSLDLRMRSDVPVGSLLSGGIDSTAIVANLASRQKLTDNAFHSYSSVYTESQYSERPYIEKTVAMYPSIRAHYVTPDPRQLHRDLDDLLSAQDGPVRSMAVYAQYCLYRVIAQQGIVKVLLNGQGADELFAGYSAYRYAWAAEALPNLSTATHRLPPGATRSLAAFWQAWRWTMSLRYGRRTSRIDAPVSISHLPPEPIRHLHKRTLRRELRQSLQLSALPEYLRYEDRNSMRFGLESRLPFLDYRLVEFAAQLPSDWLLTRDTTKKILRDAVQSYTTPAVLARRDKTGFVTPQEQWQRHELRDFMLTHLADCDFSFVDRSQWRRWLPRYADHFDSHHFAWRAVSLHMWMRQWGF